MMSTSGGWRTMRGRWARNGPWGRRVRVGTGQKYFHAPLPEQLPPPTPSATAVASGSTLQIRSILSPLLLYSNRLSIPTSAVPTDPAERAVHAQGGSTVCWLPRSRRSPVRRRGSISAPRPPVLFSHDPAPTADWRSLRRSPRRGSGAAGAHGLLDRVRAGRGGKGSPRSPPNGGGRVANSEPHSTTRVGRGWCATCPAWGARLGGQQGASRARQAPSAARMHRQPASHMHACDRVDPGPVPGRGGLPPGALAHHLTGR